MILINFQVQNLIRDKKKKNADLTSKNDIADFVKEHILIKNL